MPKINSSKPDVLRDRLLDAPLRASGNAAMAVVDSLALWHETPATQLMGITAAFMLMSKASGIPVATLFTLAENLMSDAEGRRPEFAAVEQTIREEMFDNA